MSRTPLKPKTLGPKLHLHLAPRGGKRVDGWEGLRMKENLGVRLGRRALTARALLRMTWAISRSIFDTRD